MYLTSIQTEFILQQTILQKKVINRITQQMLVQIKKIWKRKYPYINIIDYVKIYTKGDGKHTSRKEYNSRRSETKYKVIDEDRDIMGNTFYKLGNLKNI